MIARRVLLVVAVLVILCSVTLVFLSNRPPKTYSPNWTAPATLAADAGTTNFGAVPEGGSRWDLLWVDQQNRLLFRSGSSTRPIVLDHGEVDQPTLVRVGGSLFGAWIHNYNGGTELVAMHAAATGRPKLVTLIRGAAPIENPYAFVGPGGRPSLVFSWQKYGNYDVFLLILAGNASPPFAIHRLTVAQFYSFYPEAITDARGDIDLLHLESCCGQSQFKVEWDRFTPSGLRVAPTEVLDRITERGANTIQHGEALGRDATGEIWGAYTRDAGVALFRANADGVLQGRPQTLDPAPEQPRSVAFALGTSGGYGMWEEDTGVGTALASRHFDRGGMSGVERIEYLSGQQLNAHAAYGGDRYRALWQSLTPDGSYVFDTNQHRKSVGPDLAQRLGLGLGNPWSAAALLLVGAAGLGILGAVGNVIDALILTGLGLLALRLLARLRGRWLIVAAMLTAALYAIFIAPGLPLLFLTTLSALGVGGARFALAATAGSLLFVGLLGQTALRRMDDLYRMAAMAFLGLFFFAFIEAALFVQQELGYI